MDKELTIVNKELSINNVHDMQLVCDQRIKIAEDLELSIEVNKLYYAGIVERNMGYCFKIYGDYFNSGDKYAKFKKYCLYQINFNDYSHEKLDNNPVNNNKEKNDMIKNMLANGASLEFISKVSSKAIHEIEEIENSMKE